MLTGLDFGIIDDRNHPDQELSIDDMIELYQVFGEFKDFSPI
jgi:hypothetical protein